MKDIIIIIAMVLLGAVNAEAQFKDQNDPAQKVATGTQSFKKQYDRNIKKSRINGVYIPASLEEAYEELSNLSDAESVAKFRNAPEHIISRKLHFGLGRWISVNWNLEEGSRYEYLLKNMGLTNVDDMIQFTIVSWHRQLNEKPQETEKRIAEYQVAIEAKLAARRESSELLDKEVRKLEKGN